jgi:hypothetical protein
VEGVVRNRGNTKRQPIELYIWSQPSDNRRLCCFTRDVRKQPLIVVTAVKLAHFCQGSLAASSVFAQQRFTTGSSTLNFVTAQRIDSSVLVHHTASFAVLVALGVVAAGLVCCYCILLQLKGFGRKHSTVEQAGNAKLDGYGVHRTCV